MKFSFENLEVYQRAIKFNLVIDDILKREGVTRTLADQLSRAAISIPLNIAEGNGRWHKGDKRQFFWIARGSAFECIPAIEILSLKNAISGQEKESLRSDLEVIGKMLTKLAQAQDGRSQSLSGLNTQTKYP
ncbi:four helix bundle protein [Bdellovibrio bacteriovorus]|uniref:four helix bundle protein n=1 Tax=Bdellovibrio bacteriovorus TaxID=959 RepID=UPI003AA85E1A